MCGPTMDATKPNCRATSQSSGYSGSRRTRIFSMSTTARTAVTSALRAAVARMLPTTACNSAMASQVTVAPSRNSAG